MKTTYLNYRLLLTIIALFLLLISNAYSQNEIWGVTADGGSGGLGTIFKTSSTGTEKTVVYNFGGENFGQFASATKLLQHPSGLFYGVLCRGGATDDGVLFSYDATENLYTKLIDFNGDNGTFPSGPLTLGSNGKIYGTTSWGGNNNKGGIFEYDVATNVLTMRIHFTGPGGVSGSSAGITEADNGKFYGVRSYAGSQLEGVIYEFDPELNTYTEKFDFTDNVNYGRRPMGMLFKATDGTFYGGAEWGGAGAGVIFHYDPISNTYTKKFDLPANGSEGIFPRGYFTAHPNGKLYGLTQSGGTGIGVLFSYDTVTNVYTKVADFTVGTRPNVSVELAANGKLYGTTSAGGGYGNGVLFEYDPEASTLSNKIVFDRSYGPSSAALTLGDDGQLYGMTSSGGAGDSGSLFSYDLNSQTLTRKFDFNIVFGGSQPFGALTESDYGKLYGLTNTGGANGYGVLFEIDRYTHIYSKKHDLNVEQGHTIYGKMIRASNGKLYGMTMNGGSEDFGVLFEYTPLTNTYTVKVNFTEVSGYSPEGSLTQASNGKLYGLTRLGGANGQGSLFEFDPTNGSFVKKIDLNFSTGSYPVGSLKEFTNGKLYGLTSAGGSEFSGVIFEYDPLANSYTKKIDIASANGSNFMGDLFVASNGKMYGTLSGGGENSGGVLFEYNPATNGYAVKHYFNELLFSAPCGTLTEPAKGKLIGLTGPSVNNSGTIYEYNISTNTAIVKSEFTYETGAPVIQNSIISLGNNYSYVSTPVDNAENVKPSVSITATALPGSTSYKAASVTYTIEVNTSPEFTPGTAIIKSGSRTQAFTTLTYNTKYYTRVKTNKSPLYGKITTFKTGTPEYFSYAITPADGAINQYPSLDIISNQVTGATSYTIELSASEDFTSSIVKSGSRTQKFTGLQYSKQYFVRVKTNLSPNWGRTTTFTTGAPEYFSYLTTPANGAIKQNVNLSVMSRAVVGATSYTIELNTSSSFTGISMVKSGSSKQTFNNLAFNTKYYTRVKTNLSPNWGPTKSFTTGTAQVLSYVTSPEKGATVLWDTKVVVNNINASEYILQLSPASDFASGVLEYRSATTSFQVNGLQYNTQYYTRVSSNYSEGLWGAVRYFTTTTPLKYSYITSPADNATNVSYQLPVVSRTVPGASTYTIELNTSADFTGDAIEMTSESPTINFSLDHDTRYYARVKTNLSPEWGSAVKSFTTGNPISLAFIASPKNGTTGVATSVTVSVNPVPFATSYTIELNTSPDFVGTSFVQTSASRSIKFMALAAGTTYYARAYTDIMPGSWGTVSNFATKAALLGARTSTHEDESMTGTDLSVSVFPNPFKEELTVMVSSSVTQPVEVSMVDLTGREMVTLRASTNNEIVFNEPLPQGIYFLRARMNNKTSWVKLLKE